MGRVGATWRVARQADHAPGRDTHPGHRRFVVALLGAPGDPGLHRRGERIVALVGPVLHHRLEDIHQIVGLEALLVVAAGLAIGIVEAAGEHGDFAVVVDGAEDTVEVDGAVEEAPGDVAHQGAHEDVDGHGMAAARPTDAGEVGVALELELAGSETAVAGGVAGRGHVGVGAENGAHLGVS